MVGSLVWTCNLNGFLLFFQETSIELALIGEDGILQSVCEQTIFGTIKDLAVLHWNEKFRAPIPQVSVTLLDLLTS